MVVVCWDGWLIGVVVFKVKTRGVCISWYVCPPLPPPQTHRATSLSARTSSEMWSLSTSRRAAAMYTVGVQECVCRAVVSRYCCRCNIYIDMHVQGKQKCVTYPE